MPASDDDWRVQGQERYLTGRAFVWREWTAPKPDWDHDHCEFCWAKFGAVAETDVLNSGWVTSDDDYHWFCAPCFEDFRERFGWTSESGSAAT